MLTISPSIAAGDSFMDSNSSLVFKTDWLLQPQSQRIPDHECIIFEHSPGQMDPEKEHRYYEFTALDCSRFFFFFFPSS